MKPILYAGDATLTSAAAYLGGVMTYFRIPFDYLPASEPLTPDDLPSGRKLLILSDFPASRISKKLMSSIAAQVREGMGLLMIGGWQSFYGRAGEYSDTPIEEALPVACCREDDRVNYCHGLVPQPQGAHAITGDLPWNSPPVICGYNRVLPKPGSQVVMSLRALEMRNNKARFGKEKIPLLVLGEFGNGRTGALATDLAPHWVGGLVDWGDTRIQARATGGNTVEVGEHYAGLISQIIAWFVPGAVKARGNREKDPLA